MQYLLAFDQGTTGTKSLLMDENLAVVAEHTEEFPQYYPKPGWVEHHPDEIWKTILNGIQKVTQGDKAKQIAAIGITNQRETVCFWNRKTGESLAPAIVWQDRRTADRCKELRDLGHEKEFQSKTGLLLDPYFAGTKIQWALENQSVLQQAAKNGTLAVGTIDSYLISRLTHGVSHVTEPSNASRTLLFDIHALAWDQNLCDLLHVPISILPEVRPSNGLLGVTKGIPGLPDGIPIHGCLGDQQAALLGQACVEVGEAKCTFGTGAFLLMNTGSHAVPSTHRLLTTIAWQMAGESPTYALEGSAFIAGAAVQWLRDGLKCIQKSSEVEALAASVPSSEGVVFVPALTGLGAPYWDPHATGMLTGLTRGTTQAHVARATLEGIAFQNVAILEAMQKDSKKPLRALSVDGGASANNLLMQIQADLLGVELKRPNYLGSTSLGAIFAAGLGIGLWKKLNDVKKSWKIDRSFHPTWNDSTRKIALERWTTAIGRVTYHGT